MTDVPATRVSVVMAVFNGADYLVEAIDSVLAELGPNDEFIVVDDGSTDRTGEILAGYGQRLRCLAQPNAGQAAALNAGLAAARGAYLAFNDADDRWTGGRLRHQLGLLAADPSCDGTFGMSAQFVSPELDAETQARLAPPTTILAGQVATCLLIQRQSFERVGPFDPALPFAHFLDWLMRARSAGLRLSTDDMVVHERRLHPGNIGRVRRADRDAQLLGVLHRHVRATRAGQAKG